MGVEVNVLEFAKDLGVSLQHQPALMMASLHLYRSRRCTPSSRDSATMFLQARNRSTAIRRTSSGCRPTRLFGTCNSFPAKCALGECLNPGGHSRLG
jgi:hypothetical protein